MKKLKNITSNNLIAECSSNPIQIKEQKIEKTLLEIDDAKVYKKIDRVKNELFKFIRTHILINDKKWSDIWQIAYEDLYRQISDDQNLLGIYILHHIYDNQEIFMDSDLLLDLKNKLNNDVRYAENESRRRH
jgi:hypothetical protein